MGISYIMITVQNRYVLNNVLSKGLEKLSKLSKTKKSVDIFGTHTRRRKL